MEVFGMNIDLAAIVRVVLQLILLIVVFLIIMPIGKKMIEKALDKTVDSKNVSRTRMKTLEKLLVNIFTYVMFFIFIVMFFSALGIEIGPLLAGAGVIGLAIAFGAQGLVSDVVTGFFIILERQLEIDDYVTTGGYEGVVEEIGLRTTKIRSFDGTLNYVPNRYIEGVANHTRGNMRALVDIRINYDDDLEKAIGVLEQVCAEFQHDERFTDGPNAVGVQDIESSEIVLRVIGQTENGLQWACERDMKRRIKEAFDQAKIKTSEE